MPLSFFLKAVYYSLYGLVKTALAIFYREIRVEGLPPQEPKGPLIVLSNHPNTLMDPFLVVSRLQRPVFFLANASLFSHPFANWFLNTFYCIKVERQKDVNRPIDNAVAFARSRRHLESGGALYIAPEGTCYWEYRLRPLKTGAARIALDVLKTGHCREITFLMAGIHYHAPADYRSRVYMRFSTLTLRREDLHGDLTDWQHVSDLTQRLQQEMERLIPHADTEADAALREIVDLTQPRLWAAADWVEGIYRFRDQAIGRGSEIANWLAALRDVLARKGLRRLDPRWLAGQQRSRWKVLAFPVAGLVLLHHLFIYGLPELVRRRLKADSEYDSTIRYLGGIVGYLLGAPMLYYIGKSALGPGWMLWGWWITVLALGPWAWQQGVRYVHRKDWRRYQRSARDEAWSAELREAAAFLREEAP